MSTKKKIAFARLVTLEGVLMFQTTRRTDMRKIYAVSQVSGRDSLPLDVRFLQLVIETFHLHAQKILHYHMLKIVLRFKVNEVVEL